MTMNAKITEVNFTFALDGGMWVKRENGRVAWESFESLAAQMSEAEFDRLWKIAYHNGWTGMWYAVN